MDTTWIKSEIKDMRKMVFKKWKEGDRISGLCSHCDKKVKGVMLYLKHYHSGIIIKNVPKLTCPTCNNIIGMPYQGSLVIQKAVKKLKTQRRS